MASADTDSAMKIGPMTDSSLTDWVFFHHHLASPSPPPSTCLTCFFFIKESCETYSGSAGSTEQSTWRSIYAQPIADRLNTETTFNWTVTDVFAAQQLCGYDTVISGAVSAWCNATAFTNEDWLGFEYANE